MSKIILENISLVFPNTYGSPKSLRGEMVEFLKGVSHFEFISSLKSINLELNDGDKLGILGPNGSGKSSLLRVLAGIYVPTSGMFHIEGKLLSLISLTSGIDQEATGYENIFSICYMQKYRTDEIKKKLQSIIDFSELGENIYRPVRTYSSGMIMRLASSILVNFEADILILDEFISTGDKHYKEKLTNKIFEIIKKSKIFIFASHDENMVNKLCNKKIYLKKGSVVSYEGNFK